MFAAVVIHNSDELLSGAGWKQRACQLMQACTLQSPPVGGVPEQGSLDVLLSLNEVLGCQEGLRSPVQRLCVAPILLEHLRSITALAITKLGGRPLCLPQYSWRKLPDNARQAG